METALAPQNSIQLHSLNRIDNKDALLVALLEYVFVVQKRSWPLFSAICNYLKEHHIIENWEHNRELRHVYIDMIEQLLVSFGIQDNSTLQLQSRYASEFTQLDEIGGGGFGIVYRAVNNLDHHAYAIKKIHEGERHVEEIRVLSQLCHPHVVRYHTAWMEGSTLYIQMELCRGNLKEYLERRNYGDAFNRDEEWSRVEALIEATHYVHQQGVIHRDLNPCNILLDTNGTIKIGDFGLSIQVLNQQDTIHEEDSYGHILYMSPEQQNHNICSQKSDIYALGIVILELLHPFASQADRTDTIRQLTTQRVIPLNDDETDMILSMTHPDPSKRPTAEELLHSL